MTGSARRRGAPGTGITGFSDLACHYLTIDADASFALIDCGGRQKVICQPLRMPVGAERRLCSSKAITTGLWENPDVEFWLAARTPALSTEEQLHFQLALDGCGSCEALQKSLPATDTVFAMTRRIEYGKPKRGRGI